jgi:hypothetical protein
MTLKLSTWLPAAVAAGALLAGCGSSGNSTSTTTVQGTPTAATTSPATTSAGSSAPSTTSTGTTATTPAVTPLPPAQAKQAVSTCKHSVQSESAIPTSAKGKLEKTCEKAASSGSAAALRKVAEEACVELITASHLPAGVIREKALATCKVNSSVGR